MAQFSFRHRPGQASWIRLRGYDLFTCPSSSAHHVVDFLNKRITDHGIISCTIDRQAVQKSLNLSRERARATKLEAELKFANERIAALEVELATVRDALQTSNVVAVESSLKKDDRIRGLEATIKNAASRQVVHFPAGFEPGKEFYNSYATCASAESQPKPVSDVIAFGTEQWLALSDREKIQELVRSMPSRHRAEMLSILDVYETAMVSYGAALTLAKTALSDSEEEVVKLFAKVCFFQLNYRIASLLDDLDLQKSIEAEVRSTQESCKQLVMGLIEAA